MLTEKLTGYFDVRTYKPNTEKAKQPMKAEGENILFTACFKASDCPKELADGCHPYTKNGVDMVAVKFKIGKSVRWYDANAEQVCKPLNTELDGVRYNVKIDFRHLNGDASKLEACGNWVNAIQLERVEENPFKPFSGEKTSGEVETTIQEVKGENTANSLKNSTESEELPF